MMKNKKNLLAILLAAGMILATGCGQKASTNTQNQNSSTNQAATGSTKQEATGAGNTTTQQETYITEERAKEIALEKAGLETATFTKQEYDREDADYEFEFYVDDKEYECEMSAIDGQIKDYDVENRYLD